MAAMTRKNNKKNERENEIEVAAADVESNPPDLSAEDWKEAEAVGDATGVPSPPEAAAVKSKAGAKSDSEEADTPTSSNKTKAAGFISLTPKHDEEEVGVKEEVGDEEEEEEEADPILKPYNSFTMDKVDSLNYQQLIANRQRPTPRG